MKITDPQILNNLKEKGLKKLLPGKPRIAVGMGNCGIGNGSQELYLAFSKILQKKKIDISLVKVGCFGFCSQEPLVNIYIPGKPLIILNKVLSKDAEKIINNIDKEEFLLKKSLCKIEKWDHLTSQIHYGEGFNEIPHWNEISFFKGQKKIVLRNCGLINPEDIEEYIAVGGYSTLYNVLKGLTPEKVVEEVKNSKLRGRGGAGFPTGIKWEIMRKVVSDKKYIICNAHEGDPGTFVNRSEIESDPHMLLEGMAIGAFAVGADEGIIYIHTESPLPVERLKNAIQQAKNYGLLGENILNSGFNFDIHIVESGGAFICGEETALFESIEGKIGKPRIKPPFPAQKGVYDKPTNINNVETWCNVPVIVAKGGNWFAEIGTVNSGGTKVFSLVGKIENKGLIEVPLGTSLKTVVYNIGSGKSKNIKSVEIGGPAGGCIPQKFFNTILDYESIAKLGVILGSGEMVIMDKDDCMVDVARFFVEFNASESCGKCVPCREGLYQVFKIINSITKGKATEDDLKQLENLCNVIKDTAFCGLGQAGVNPVLTTLQYFRNEYEEHIKEKRCQAGICKNLYLSPCENSCPLHMNIPGFLEMYEENRNEESFESILQDNPFPAVTGRVCHHPCEARCRRTDIDEPVLQREVHRWIADSIYEKGKDKIVFKKMLENKLPATGKKVAIVGAGPAGLTAGFYLVRLGHSVTIYDSKPFAGGMLRIIPEYRLPQNVLEREIQFIKKLGVKFVFNTKIGINKSLEQLEKEHNAIFLAIGAHKNIALDIPGEDLKGVLPGIKFLEDIAVGKKPAIGKKIVIIGGGNVAIDAARTSVRLGSEVTIAYRREKDDMPANKEEIEEAKIEGIKFIFLSAPGAIIGDEKGKVREIELTRMVPGEFDSSGRRKPMPTEETYKLSCDTVIFAIGERVDSEFIKKFGIKTRDNGAVEVNNFTLQTNNPRIYVGGDITTGPATLTEAMSAGKKAAKSMDMQLTGKDRFDLLFKKFTYKNIVPVEPRGGKRQQVKKLSRKGRKGNFKEVSLGFSDIKAKIESSRCLRCDVEENRVRS